MDRHQAVALMAQPLVAARKVTGRRRRRGWETLSPSQPGEELLGREVDAISKRLTPEDDPERHHFDAVPLAPPRGYVRGRVGDDAEPAGHRQLLDREDERVV